MCCALSVRKAVSKSRISGSPPATKGGTGRIDVFRGDKVETIELPEDRWLYSFEVDAAGEAIRQGKQEFVAPGMGWADSLGNLRVMDQWRAAVGLEYSVEKATSRITNIAGGKVVAGNAVPKRQIPGLTKPASVVALGFEFFPNFASASLTLDAFMRRAVICSIQLMSMAAARRKPYSVTGTPAATCRAKKSC